MTLRIALYCKECKIPLSPTNEGLACSKCEEFMSDGEMEVG